MTDIAKLPEWQEWNDVFGDAVERAADANHYADMRALTSFGLLAVAPMIFAAGRAAEKIEAAKEETELLTIAHLDGFAKGREAERKESEHIDTAILEIFGEPMDVPARLTKENAGKVRNALSLMNSMILCGKDHSLVSLEAFEDAKSALAALETK